MGSSSSSKKVFEHIEGENNENARQCQTTENVIHRDKYLDVACFEKVNKTFLLQRNFRFNEKGILERRVRDLYMAIFDMFYSRKRAIFPQETRNCPQRRCHALRDCSVPIVVYM